MKDTAETRQAIAKVSSNASKKLTSPTTFLIILRGFECFIKVFVKFEVWRLTFSFNFDFKCKLNILLVGKCVLKRKTNIFT